MEPARIEATHRGEAAARRPRARTGEGPAFEDVLREVHEDLDRLERLTESARRAASEEGPGDPEAFREAVRESEEALRSARKIRSRLLGAYRATLPGDAG